MVTMSELAARVAAQGGAVLAIDYGQPGPYTSSLQARLASCMHLEQC